MERAVGEIRRKVGSGRVLLALSGGVDSSVAAALLSEAVGDQLTCVFVDHGLLRLNEADEVMHAFSGRRLRLVRVDAQARFLRALMEEPFHYVVYYLLAICTGCRRGELCALKWSDFLMESVADLTMVVSRSRSSVSGIGVVEGTIPPRSWHCNSLAQ